DKATDPETPQNGLSYNFYMGTSSNTEDIASCLSDISTGKRKVVKVGNAQYSTSWDIRNLPSGTYYWRVQSIDNNFAGSPFSVEDSFEVIAPEVTDVIP